MKLIALLKDLILKSGVPETEAAVATLLADATIQNIEVADDTANKINAGLLNLTAAEAHPTIRTKLIAIGRAEAFDGVDSEINATMTELGLADDVKTKILAEKSTTKRAALLAKEVKAVSEKGGSDVTEKIKTINELNKKISDMQTEKQTEIDKIKSESAERFLQQSIDFDLSGFSYIFPDNTPMTTKLAAAKASVLSKLAKDGAKVITDNAGNKKIVKQDGTDYYDTANKAVEYNDYLKAALTQDNLLAVSKEHKKTENPRNPDPTKIPGQEDKGDTSFLAAADSDIDNLDKALEASGDKII